MKNCFRMFRKHEYGMMILRIQLFGCYFRWFTDCGEWFIYIGYDGNKKHRFVRLSSVGCYYEKYKEV